MAELWVLVGGVVVLSLMLLWFLGESVALTYEAWLYRKREKEKRIRIARGEEVFEDQIWDGRLGGLEIQTRWGPLYLFGALIGDSVLLARLTEGWIAVLVGGLCLVLFIGMWVATFLMNHLRIPPPPPSE